MHIMQWDGEEESAACEMFQVRGGEALEVPESLVEQAEIDQGRRAQAAGCHHMV
jgi:hypothetical protein